MPDDPTEVSFLRNINESDFLSFPDLLYPQFVALDDLEDLAKPLGLGKLSGTDTLDLPAERYTGRTSFAVRSNPDALAA